MNQHQGQEMNSIESEERLVIAKIGRKSTIKNLAIYISLPLWAHPKY